MAGVGAAVLGVGAGPALRRVLARALPSLLDLQPMATSALPAQSVFANDVNKFMKRGAEIEDIV